MIVLLSILILGLSQERLLAQEKVIPYTPKPGLPKVWVSKVPDSCPFESSRNFSAIAFTGKHVSYTDADIWYPSWASDGSMYSDWTDGEITGENSS